MKKICTILLNWKGADDTIDCLKSFLTQSHPEALHVVVIDNASPDDSVERILSWANEHGIALEELNYLSETQHLSATGPTAGANSLKITLIRSDKNIGFCAGNNLGAKFGFERGADYALILNNDTVVPANFNATLQSVLADDDGMTLYSPQIAYASAPETIWWFGGRFSKLLSPTYLSQGDTVRMDARSKPETQWVSGCATLISSSVYDKLGLYDPTFFIWCEEWDLSLRAAKTGVPMRVIPSVLVYHKVGKSLGITSPLTFFYAMRNMMILRKRYLALHLRIPFNLAYIPYKLIQAVILTLKQGNSKYLADSVDAFKSIRKGGNWKRQG